MFVTVLDVARALWIGNRLTHVHQLVHSLPSGVRGFARIACCTRNRPDGPSLGNPPVRDGREDAVVFDPLLRRVGPECRRLKPARPQSVTNAPCVIRVYVDVESRCVPTVAVAIRRTGVLAFFDQDGRREDRVEIAVYIEAVRVPRDAMRGSASPQPQGAMV